MRVRYSVELAKLENGSSNIQAKHTTETRFSQSIIVRTYALWCGVPCVALSFQTSSPCNEICRLKEKGTLLTATSRY